MGIIKIGNVGLVTTTAGPDLCHTLPVDPVSGIARSVILRKIMAYNPGADATLVFGTQTNVGGWVPMLPTLVAVGPFDNEWLPEELPQIEFRRDTTAAAGTTGNILVQSSALNLLILIEVEEIGESRKAS